MHSRFDTFIGLMEAELRAFNDETVSKLHWNKNLNYITFKINGKSFKTET